MIEQYDEATQLHGRLVNMSTHLEAVHAELTRLSQETAEHRAQLTALVQHLIHSESTAQIQERLAHLATQADEVQDRLEQFEKGLKKLSRTQFKTNTLTESKEQQVSDTVALLQGLLEKREAVCDDLANAEQRALAESRSEARGELAADCLPVLDGIELALTHGHAMLTEPQPNKRSPGMLRRLFGHSSGETPAPQPELNQEARRRLQGWLDGLEIVRERCLKLLAAERIEPIPDLHEPFDPHQHVAVEAQTRCDVPDNTVITVLRKGYRQRERILRYSEVIVAKSPDAEPATPANSEQEHYNTHSTA